jgi:hypothetical protein
MKQALLVLSGIQITRTRRVLAKALGFAIDKCAVKGLIPSIDG